MNKLWLTLLMLLLSTGALAAEGQEFHWFIYYGDARVGWHTTAVERAEHDGVPVIIERDTSHVSILRRFDGNAFTSNSTTTTIIRECGRLLSREVTFRQGPQTRVHRVEVDDTEIRVTTRIDGGTPMTTALLPGDKPVLASSGPWLHLADNGDTELRFQTVSHGDHALMPQVWRVTGTDTWSVGGAEFTGTAVLVRNHDRFHDVLMGDDGQPLVLRHGSDMAQVRTPELPDEFQPEPVQLRNIMDSEVNVRPFSRIEEMQVELKFNRHPELPHIAESNRYHDVEATDDGYRFTLKAQPVSDAARAAAYPLADVPDELKEFLRPTPMAQADDPVLMRHAQMLSRRHDNAHDVAHAIMMFVRRHLRGGSGPTGSASARQAYNERGGDCTEHAALFVALARAAGLPAREVTGMAYISMGENRALWGFHAWAEVWLGEWVPLDSTVRELGLSARYIKFGISEPGHIKGSGSISRTVQQGITPRITAYRLRDGTRWPRLDEEADDKADEQAEAEEPAPEPATTD